MPYINMKSPYIDGVETVDEFQSYREDVKMAREYNLSDPSGHYYVSRRSTKEWRKR